MLETENLKLKLPESNDYVNVETLNKNFQALDDAVAGKMRIVIGAEAPTSGPALWFNTGAAAAAAQEAAMLSLNDDEDTGSVIAEVEGEQYAVENATIDTEPTTPGVYDFTIL